MNPIKRLDRFKEKDFNELMILISNGSIKCGRYAHLVKIDKNKKIKNSGVFFDENSKSE